MKPYVIKNNDWDEADEGHYLYTDDSLSMWVTIERKYNFDNPRYDDYAIAVCSGSIKDENNTYYYDALSAQPYCGPILDCLSYDELFDRGANGDVIVHDVTIPQWVIDQMQYLIECDKTIDDYAYDWAKSNDHSGPMSREEIEDSIYNYFIEHCASDDRIEDSSEIQYYAENCGYINWQGSRAYVNA